MDYRSRVLGHRSRRAIVRFGEPIDVAKRLADLGKPRLANPLITSELEVKIQSLLDAIGPGRLLPETTSRPSRAKVEVGD